MSLNAIAVVGTGPAGLAIATAVAEAELPVIAICVTGARQDLARKRLDKTLAMRVTLGELTLAEAKAIGDRVTFTRDLARVRDHDLVIESTVGDIRSRRALLATVKVFCWSTTSLTVGWICRVI